MDVFSCYTFVTKFYIKKHPNNENIGRQLIYDNIFNSVDNVL